MNNTVVVGMSGGVDSSVAAYLLKKQGYDVIGVTMQVWQTEEQAILEDNGGCCGLRAVDDARRVAQYLKIPYYVMNFKDDFRHFVINGFISEYLEGRTPNPCIACNRYVKWNCLLRRARQIGADYIATGHYARVVSLDSGRMTIKKSHTVTKDQTYVLYSLTQEELKHTLMQIGDYDKDEVRKIASAAGLPTAHKSDSQDICFVPDHDYAGYIEREAGDRLPGPGFFVDKDGNILGRNKGITHYTVGQRKGLGLSLGKPAFVTEIRPETNEVVIGDAADVMSNHVFFNNVNAMAHEKIDVTRHYTAKIRYSQTETGCSVEETSPGCYRADFDKPVRAAAPGQAIVLYDGDIIEGGGTITGRE